MREYPTALEHFMLDNADAVCDVLIKAREALLNVPMVGDKYDQQHSDTHTRAYLAIHDLLKQIYEDEPSGYAEGAGR